MGISATKKVQLITFWEKGRHTLPFREGESIEWKVEFLSFQLGFDVIKASGFDFSFIIFGYVLIVYHYPPLRSEASNQCLISCCTFLRLLLCWLAIIIRNLQVCMSGAYHKYSHCRLQNPVGPYR